MGIKSLNQTLSSAFSVADTQTKIFKASLVGLCSDVDRYFRVKFDLDIYSSINDQGFYKIKWEFPNLRKLSLEQFNRLLFTFISIRDVAAHLFLNKAIYLDEDIEKLIKSNVDAPYKITNGEEATVFGAICVCLLFSQKYQLNSFNTEAIRHNVFAEVPKEKLGEFQQAFQKSVSKLVGLGKICPLSDHLFLKKTDVMAINEEIKKSLTRLLFDLEQHAIKNQKMSSRTLPIKILLGKYKCLENKPELIELICDLRNFWLHGYRLFDYIKNSNKETVFDLDYIFDLLFEIKKAFNNAPNSYSILSDLSNCGSKIIDCFTLRGIELSYKLLDQSLFDKEKSFERLCNSNIAYGRCLVPEPWFYEKALKLINDDNKTWYLSANKFSDKKERVFRTNELEIYDFQTKKGIDLNDTHFDVDGFALANIQCPLDQQIKINGKYLNEYKTDSYDTFWIFKIYSIQL